MTYKIIKIQSILNQDKIFDDPTSNLKSYNEFNEILTRQYIGFPTFEFVKSFKSFGCSAKIIFYDSFLSQSIWAKENYFKFNKSNWMEEILLEQLKSFKPDVIYFQDIFSLKENIRFQIKKIVPSIKIVLIQKGYPGETRDLSDADILIVNSPILKQRYNYLKPYLIYHSFDSTILDIVDKNEGREDNLAFFGSLRFPELRFFFLKEISNNVELKLWTDDNVKEIGQTIKKNTLKSKLKKLTINIFFNNFVRFFLIFINKYLTNKKIFHIINKIDHHNTKTKKDFISISSKNKKSKDNFKPKHSLYGVEYYKQIKKTKICINLNSDCSSNTADNMKMFEIAGMGSCLLTEHASNIQELFRPDEEIVTYKSTDEALEKINYLLKNDKVLERIALNGKKRILKEHTFFHRSKEINKIINAKI